MGKALIIAEKPSVASDIAKALGGLIKHDDFYENDQYVISSAVGHLLELRCPEEFEAKKGKWTFAHLPVIPPHFDLEPIERNEKRLKLLTKLKPASPLLPKAALWLVNHRDQGYYWASTKQTAMVVFGLTGYLKDRGLKKVYLVGLATDFCVAWSALDARKAGFEAAVIEDATRGIDAGGSLAKAWTDMTGAGVQRLQSSAIDFPAA